MKQEGALFAGEIIGFILGRGDSTTSKLLLPLDQLQKELDFRPKTKQGFLQIIGIERDASRFGISGISLKFKSRIRGFQHKRGSHLLIAVDRKTGHPIGSIYPIYADSESHFLVKKDFVTSLGIMTEQEDAIFLPYGVLDGSFGSMEPYFCMFSIVDDHPGILFSEGVPIEDPEIFAEHRVVPVPISVGDEDDLGAFEEAVIALTAAVIKVDGVIKPEEIQVVRKFFSQVFHGQAKKMGKVRATLKKFLSKLPPMDFVYGQVVNRCIQEKQIVVALLLNIASSDGQLDDSELRLIDEIRKRFGIADSDFEKMTADFQPEDFPFYKALGVSPGATWEEIKEAHRIKAKEYHPDLYPQLPESFREFAKREFMRISIAYQKLREKLGK